MKTIINSDYKFINSINHQDKLFVFALRQDPDKAFSEIYYSLQDPKSTTNNTTNQMTDVHLDDSWKPFDKLNFPSYIRPIGIRLGAYRVEGFENNGERKTTEIYTRNEDYSVISDGITITLFRKVDANVNNSEPPKYKIFADRFVYNTKLGRLFNINEVRYIRSGNPDVPESQLDSFGVQNPNGQNFIEPTSEISLENITDFRFAAISIPIIGQLYQSVWHFFIYRREDIAQNPIEVYSIPRSTSVLFDTSFCKIAEDSINILPTLILNDRRDAGVITGLDAAYYDQQAETVNQDGALISLKTGTHVMLVANRYFLAQDGISTPGMYGESIDLEVGADGYLAGMKKDTYEIPTYEIFSKTIAYYGTALEFDGRNDFVESGSISTRQIEDGLTISIWSNIKNDFSKQFSRHLWTLNNIELKDKDELVSISLFYNQIGKFSLYISSFDEPIAFTNVPSFQFNQWNNFFIKFPEAKYANAETYFAINGIEYKIESLGLVFKDTEESKLIIGLPSNSIGDDGFQGLLGEVRMFFNEVQLTQSPNFAPIVTSELPNKTSQKDLILCEAFNEGSGSKLTSYLSEDEKELSNLVTDFTIFGAQWVSSAILSRINMKTQYVDDNLLKCTAALIRNNELQNTVVPSTMELNNSPALLDRADGILRAYCKSANPAGSTYRLGVAHFDTISARFQKSYFWENDNNDVNYLLIPKIIFQSLITGSDMNDAEINIRWQPGGEGIFLEILANKRFNCVTGPSILIEERWTNFRSESNRPITAIDIVNLVNGTSDFYNYDSNFNRKIVKGNEQQVDSHTPRPSMLFHAEAIFPDNENDIQFFPSAPLITIAEQTTERVSYGMDSTWVLDPIPAALHLQKANGAFVLIDDVQLPDRNFSLESWINIEEALSSNTSNKRTPIFQHSGDYLDFICSFDKDGSVFINLINKVTNSHDVKYKSDREIIVNNVWQHLALEYKTGYAINFQDNLYIEIPNEKNLNTGNEITVEGWYFISEENKPRTASRNDGPQIIMSKWDPDNDDTSWRMFLNIDNQLGFEVVDDEKNIFQILSNQPIEANNSWNHITGQYAKPSTQNMMFIDETDGDVHFEIPPFSNQWTDDLTIEFKTGSDGNEEADEFTFLSYVFQPTPGTNKNFLEIGRWWYEDLAIALGEDKEDQFDANDSFLVLTCFDQIVSFPKPFIFKPHEIVHIALTVDIINTTKIRFGLYINGEDYGEALFNLDDTMVGYLQQLKEDDFKVRDEDDEEEDKRTYQQWVIGASFEHHNNNDILRRHFSGYLSHLRIWNYIRTEQQILDYINLSVQQDAKGLLAVYTLNEAPMFSPEDSNEFRIINLVNGKVAKPNFKNDNKGVYWAALTINPKLDLLLNGKLMEDVIYKLNRQLVDANLHKISNPIFTSKSPLHLGQQGSGNFGYLEGKLDNVRIWNKYRLPAQIDYYRYNDLGESTRSEKNMEVLESLVGYWAFDQGKGSIVLDSIGTNIGTIKGMDIKEEEEDDLTEQTWVPSTFNGKFRLFIDGRSTPISTNSYSLKLNTNIARKFLFGGYVEESKDISFNDWYIGEVRLWSKLLSAQTIKNNLHNSLSGNESKLENYWRCVDGSYLKLLDQTKNKKDGDLIHLLSGDSTGYTSWVNVGLSNLLAYPIPISNDSQSCVNISNNIATLKSESIELYGDITVAEFNNFQQLFLGYLTKSDDGSIDLNLETDTNAGEIILVYIGQGQYDARIVGFIEGAPPVPCENLSVDDPSNPDKYVGTSTVTFSAEGSVNTDVSNEESHSHLRELETYFGGAFEYELKAAAGPPVALKFLKFSKMEANIYLDRTDGKETTETNTESISVASNAEELYSLTLGGAWEPNIYNIANVPSNKLYIQGNRLYRPNNMGIAVVKSKTADLYAIQNSITKKTIGTKPVVDPNIPEDTNYIMFKINPDYIKNGSLDGKIGFDHDTQYPDLSEAQKASFYKAQEAYQLQSRIEREQEEWKNTLSQTEIPSDDSIAKSKELSLVNSYVWTADGGFFAENKQFTVSHIEQHDSSLTINHSTKIGGDFKSLFGVNFLYGFEVKAAGLFANSHTTTKSMEDSTQNGFSLDVEVEGEGFLSMQADMYTVIEKIINTNDNEYLENKSSLDAGYDNCKNGGNLAFWNQLAINDYEDDDEVDINNQILTKDGDVFEKFIIIKTGIDTWNLATANAEYEVVSTPEPDSINNTIVFTKRTTPHLGQYPILFQANNCPGKVTSYRFKSFYLHASKENFEVLKDGYSNDLPLIDDVWLKDPDNPDAVAMSEALKNSNRIWRIFHRVTYVSRVVPDDSIAEQNFASIDPSNIPVYIDSTSQTIQKPDPISIDNNFLLIKIIMGQSGLPGYKSNIDPLAPNFEDVKFNINLWIDRHDDSDNDIETDDYQLDGVERERLFYLMLNYFTAYLLKEDE